MQEKRMGKLDAIRERLAPPSLEGPANADVTLLGWGSTRGVVSEAVEKLTAAGLPANQLHLKYLHPFHAQEVGEILAASRRIIVVENNSSGQFARHLRAETGIKAHDVVLKYDGEPFTPAFIVRAVEDIVAGRPRSLDVSEDEAREMAYHIIRTKLGNNARPVSYERVELPGHDEPLWQIGIVGLKDGQALGTLLVGVHTGAIVAWQEVAQEAVVVSTVTA
jgi:hypothetical protein